MPVRALAVVIFETLASVTRKVPLLWQLRVSREVGTAYGVVWLNERVVDGDDLDVVVLNARRNC
jgi:hypothetical protein